jgi:hypothetical protein
MPTRISLAKIVMPPLVAGIHVLKLGETPDVDCRVNTGHDEFEGPMLREKRAG